MPLYPKLVASPLSSVLQDVKKIVESVHQDLHWCSFLIFTFYKRLTKKKWGFGFV